jgi:endoglucanase
MTKDYQPVLARLCTTGSFVFLALFFSGSAWSQESLWASYKERFVSSEGRVIDNGNGGVSHSEGQGYGLILAQANGDRETFERIWNWTKTNLAARSDHLFSWRWKPSGKGEEGAVDDKNNASDGDLLIAWGLARAAQVWQDPGFKASARAIARDIRRLMIRSSRYGPVLLPGAKGFEKPEGLVLNLSYWVFPAFRTLAKIDPSSDWLRLEQSGLKLVEVARFSPLSLPPDWLALGKNSLNPAQDFESVYGFNAVRIPLYLAWAGIKPARYYTGFRTVGLTQADGGNPPAKVFLPSGKLGPDPALPGMQAIYRLIAGTGDINLADTPVPYQEAPVGEVYYSMSLGLLSNFARAEGPTMNR